MNPSFINTLFCGVALLGLPLSGNAQEPEYKSIKAEIKIQGTPIAHFSMSEKTTRDTAQEDSGKNNAPPSKPNESKAASDTSEIPPGAALPSEDKKASPTTKLATSAKEDYRARWEAEVKHWNDPMSVTDDADPTDGSNVAVGRNLVIQKTSAGHVLCIGGSTAILKEISGHVVVIGGDAIILAPVTGKIVAIGGDVKIDAKVEGRVAALGGRVIEGLNAQVADATSVSSSQIFSNISGARLFESFFFSKVVLTWRLVLLIWNACISLLLVSLFGSVIRRAETILRDRRGASFITGLVWTPIYWLLLIGAVALCFFGVGIPILLVLLILNFALETFGLSVVGLQLGRWLLHGFNHPNPSEHLAVFTGICALGVFRIIPVFGFVGWWMVCWLGIGAALMNLFSKQQQAATEN